ncbi:MAG TPA: hypothetical protein VM581_01195 [Magnetospirillaceae bacterium]|nr:hypothetical protein [Magnetospirillaceae bacterium]
MKFPWAQHKKKQTRQPRLMEGQESYIFRRSRTITGTKSVDVAVGAPSRGQFKTDRIKLIELRAHRKRVFALLSGVMLVVVLLSFLIANFIVTPPIGFTQQGISQTADPYQKTIQQYFNDHPFERFGMLLRQADLEAAIMRSHAEVLAVGVEREWYGGNVQFSLTFRQPLLVWQTGSKRFYVDAQGVAFTYNHFTAPTLAVTDQSGIPPDETGVVASTRFLRFLGQLVAAVNGYGLGTIETIIIPSAPRQIDVKLQGREYIIKTNTDRDPGQQAEDLANALKYFDRKGIKPQYVDVRVAHRAFYK